jgi:regulator of PEP synthase PpsR (kinase-PPPase family)
MPNRTVFFLSDGTGITAETFGNSILAQFEGKPRHVRRPFIDTTEKAYEVVPRDQLELRARGTARRRVHHAGQRRGARIVTVRAECRGLVLDMFRTSSSRSRRSSASRATTAWAAFPMPPRARSTTTASRPSTSAWRTTTGRARNLAAADVILVGVSRSGKTPTSLYLAMQHGIKAANYPLIPEDFERGKLPSALTPYKGKCFGLTIDPERLAQIRNERRPGSKYADAAELPLRSGNEAERMMKREGIAWLSSTHKSIEEIATTILRDIRPDRLIY